MRVPLSSVAAAAVPAPGAVLLYLDDFAGGLCRPVVAEGQTVRLGDPVGVSDGGAWVHASVSGTVRAVRTGALIVENDFRSTPGRSVEPLSSLEGVARAAVERVNRGELDKGRELVPVYHRLSQAERERLAREQASKN